MEGGPPCFPQTHRGSWYSGTSAALSLCLYGTLTPSGGAFQRLPVQLAALLAGPTTPSCLPKETRWFGLFPPRSPLLRESRLISSRRATEMFQFAHCPSSCLSSSAGDVQTSLWTGCPIRILRALSLYAAPPERFAGLRVLLRPSAPRHPPRTLVRLCSLLVVVLFAFLPASRHFSAHVLTSRSTHIPSRSSASLLSSCLGNIEVIMLFSCLVY